MSLCLLYGDYMKLHETLKELYKSKKNTFRLLRHNVNDGVEFIIIAFDQSEAIYFKGDWSGYFVKGNYYTSTGELSSHKYGKFDNVKTYSYFEYHDDNSHSYIQIGMKEKDGETFNIAWNLDKK